MRLCVSVLAFVCVCVVSCSVVVGVVEDLGVAICAFLRANVYIFMCIYVYVCMYVYIYVYMNICIYVYIHIYIRYTYTHTCTYA